MRGASLSARPNAPPYINAASKFGGNAENFRRSFNRLRKKTVGRLPCKNKNLRLAALPRSAWPYFARMTRARNAAKGLVTPPPLHRLMEAVLLLCVSLVQSAATVRMIFNPNARDWHTRAGHEALPQPTTGSHQQEAHVSQPSFSGKAEGRIPGIPVVPPQGTTPYSPGQRALRASRTPLSLCHSRRSASARRAGTRKRHPQASAHAAPGFGLTRFARVRNDTVRVSATRA